MGNLERISFIDSRIRERGGVTVKEVASRFEVSDRQVKRDIEYLRYRLGAPLELAPDRRSYRYGSEWRGLDFADEKALLFYVLARAAAGTIAYVPIAEANALDHLLGLVPRDLRSLESAIRYELPEFEPVDAEQLAIVLDAFRQNGVLDVKYRDLEGRVSERRIAPRRIVNYSGVWYIAAWDLELRALRIFRARRFEHISLERSSQGAMRKAVESAEASEGNRGPSETEIDCFLDASYGMFKGQADKTAVARFYGKAMQIVKDELWHKAQGRKEGRDRRLGPYVELELPLSSWDEILGRLLRFGAEAEAVAPPEFRERWLAAIEDMAARAAGIRAEDVNNTTTFDRDKGCHSG